MGTVIRVKPASANRRGFAQWAARNRVRTVESTTFGVPAHLFDQIPEELLRGSVVDGQSYVPVPQASPAARPARKTTPAPAGKPTTAPAAPAPVTPAGDIDEKDSPSNVTPAASVQVSASNSVENREVEPPPVTDEQRAAADELSRLGQEIEAIPPRNITIGASIEDVSLPSEPEPVPPQRTSRALPAPVESPQRVCHCGHVAATAHGLKVHVGKAHNGGGDA